MNPERLVAIVIAVALHAYFLLFFTGRSQQSIEAAGIETGTEVEVELAEAASEPSDTPPEPTPPEPVPPVPPEPEVQPEPEPTPVTDESMVEPEPPKEKPKPRLKPQPKPAAPKASPGVRNVAQSAGATTGATGGAVGGSKDSSRPRWKRKIEPPYPTTAKAARVEGRVTVLISVSADGRATSARVNQSSGNASLDDAAQRAAMASTFYPTIRDGVPVADTVPAPYRFTLNR